MSYLADAFIIALLVIAVYFILRNQIRRIRSGWCNGGCPGCSGGCSGCTNVSVNKTKK